MDSLKIKRKKLHSTRDALIQVLDPSRRLQQALPEPVPPAGAPSDEELIEKSRILRGFPKPRNADNNTSILPSAHPVLKSGIPDLVILERINITLTNKHDANFAHHIIAMKQGWTKAAIEVPVPHVSIEGRISHSHSNAKEINEELRCFMAVNTFARLRLTVDLDIARINLDPKFVRGLDRALNVEDEDTKRLHLSELFTQYGDVIGTDIIMGAEYRAWKEISSSSEEDIRDVRRQIIAAVRPQAIPAQVSLGNGHSEHHASKRHLNIQDLHFCRVGGNSSSQTENDSYNIWRGTVENPRYWDVIRVQSVVPILDLISLEKRQQVLSAFGPPLQVKRAPSHSVIRSRHFAAYHANITEEDFAAGWRSLGQTRDSGNVFMIRQRDPADNALSLIVSSERAWHVLSLHHHFRRLHAEGGYRTLGILFGKLDQSQMSRVCAVREDLLAPATLERLEEEGRSTFRLLDRVRDSLWKVVSIGDEEAATICMGSFRMARVTKGMDRPDKRVWGIKKEYVEELKRPKL